MAPIKPRTASKARAPTKQSTTYPTTSDAFAASKKDKRTMKHSILMSKVQKSAAKPLKRRRPSKKLVTTLSSLADALPDADDDAGADTIDGERVVGQARIRHKSLKSRPGAMKRKEKLERIERERMEKNMAQLASSAPPATMQDSTLQNEAGGVASAPDRSQRWAALRSFIGSTMEKKEEFRNP